MGTKSVFISSKNILSAYLNQIKTANHTVLGSIYLEKKIKLPQKGGIYIFWWNGKSDLLMKNIITQYKDNLVLSVIKRVQQKKPNYYKTGNKF